MSKLVRLKLPAWFLSGWLAVFAVLFPQGVFVCIGEPAHLELEIFGGACCDGDSDLEAILISISTDLPTDTCADCHHIQVTSWLHHSSRQLGKSFDRNMNVRNQSLCIPAPTFGNLDKHISDTPLPVADPIPPLLLEHLSTSILIC
jgi:hypothetical protein